MTFCLIPKVLYPVDVVLPFGKVCTVVDAQVAKLTEIQHIIALITNGHHAVSMFVKYNFVQGAVHSKGFLNDIFIIVN